VRHSICRGITHVATSERGLSIATEGYSTRRRIAREEVCSRTQEAAAGLALGPIERASWIREGDPAGAAAATVATGLIRSDLAPVEFDGRSDIAVPRDRNGVFGRPRRAEGTDPASTVFPILAKAVIRT